VPSSPIHVTNFSGDGKGVIVTKVIAGGAGARANIEERDCVLLLGGAEVDDNAAFIGAMKAHRPGRCNHLFSLFSIILLALSLLQNTHALFFPPLLSFLTSLGDIVMLTLRPANNTSETQTAQKQLECGCSDKTASVEWVRNLRLMCSLEAGR
jgi:hypothetical protein